MKLVLVVGFCVEKETKLVVVVPMLCCRAKKPMPLSTASSARHRSFAGAGVVLVRVKTVCHEFVFAVDPVTYLITPDCSVQVKPSAVSQAADGEPPVPIHAPAAMVTGIVERSALPTRLDWKVSRSPLVAPVPPLKFTPT